MEKAESGAKEIRVVKEMKTKAKHEIEMEITQTRRGTIMLLQINKVQSSEAAASTLTLSLDDEEKL